MGLINDRQELTDIIFMLHNMKALKILNIEREIKKRGLKSEHIMDIRSLLYDLGFESTWVLKSKA